MHNKIQVIIATKGFRMTMNKQDVRFVIHFSMPESLDFYIKQCELSGRDGLRADCILYYDYNDR